MCELAVRLIDKVGDTDELDARCTKRGDVIVIKPDGWQWGRAELNDPQYEIVRVPGVTVDQAASLVAAEVDSDPRYPSPVLHARAHRLDLDKPRPTTYDELMACRIKKPSRPNPLSL